MGPQPIQEQDPAGSARPAAGPRGMTAHPPQSQARDLSIPSRPGYAQPMQPPRAGMTWRLAALLSILVAAGGCASGNHAGESRRPDRDFPNLGEVSARSWPFWPQRLRVHPLTQFVTDRRTGRELLEVRVEFFDPYGHTCKAFGRIMIEVYDANDFNADASVQWIGDHEMDLTELEVNAERYDDVTRTYLFSLEVEDLPIPKSAEVRVYFQAGDGTRLQAAYVLPDREPPGGSGP